MTSLTKTLTILATAVAAMGLSHVASAAPSLVLDRGIYQNGDGGEFTALGALPTPFGLHGYASSTSTSTAGVLTSFDTFCVQDASDDVTFTPGDRYDYTISEDIQGGALDHPPRGLNQAVAWLYMEFATGKLAGYDFSNSLGQRTADAGILQNEIWYLEGEIGNPGANAYATDLTTAGIPTNTLASVGEYGVEVLGLYTLNVDGAPVWAQNQLVYNNGGFGGNGTPNVPDNGLTIALLGVSFLGFALLKRKTVRA